MNKTAWWIIGILVVIGVVLVYIHMSAKDETPAVTNTATSFGKVLQNVSLLAPDAGQQIATTYAPYIAPALLSQWANDPTHAPGRLTSSPWPDRINVISADKQADGSYIVVGTLVEASSTGDAGSYQVNMTLVKNGGAWQITQFSGYPPQQAA